MVVQLPIEMWSLILKIARYSHIERQLAPIFGRMDWGTHKPNDSYSIHCNGAHQWSMYLFGDAQWKNVSNHHFRSSWYQWVWDHDGRAIFSGKIG